MRVKRKILVVDADFRVRDSLKEELITEGYEPLCAGDGKTAIESIIKEKFDLILLDLGLNGMDGIWILQKTRNIDEDVPAILMSGFLTAESIERASKFGLFGYIAKPFEIDELMDKVRRALNNGRSKKKTEKSTFLQ